MVHVIFKAPGAMNTLPSETFLADDASSARLPEDELEFPEIILALHHVSKLTAAACYKASTNTLLLYEDSPDSHGDLAVLSACWQVGETSEKH